MWQFFRIESPTVPSKCMRTCAPPVKCHVTHAAVLCCRKMIGQDEERLEELSDRVARKTEEMRKAKASIKQLLELMQSFRRSYGVCQQQRGALKQQVRLVQCSTSHSIDF